MARDSLSPSGKAEMLLCGGLDIDLRGIDLKRPRNVLFHLRDMAGKLWRLSNDCNINILNPVLLR